MDTRDHRPTGGIEGLIGGLTNLLNSVHQLAEKGQELRNTQGQPGERGYHFDYGVRVRTLDGGRDVRVEPFGNVRTDAAGAPTIDPTREPIVDVFDEGDHMLIVAELPGVGEDDVRIEVNGASVTIAGESAHTLYRKIVTLPRSMSDATPTITARNGIYEIRLEG